MAITMTLIAFYSYMAILRQSHDVLGSNANEIKLVGGLNHFLFSIIYGIILPIDELIFFKMVIAPPVSPPQNTRRATTQHDCELRESPQRWMGHVAARRLAFATGGHGGTSNDRFLVLRFSNQ